MHNQSTNWPKVEIEMEAGPKGQATPSHRDQNVTTLLKTVVEARENIEKEQRSNKQDVVHPSR